MVPMMLPLPLHDPNGSFSGFTWAKSHSISYHIDHLDPGNAVVLLNMLSASHDADTNAKVSHNTNININIM